MSHPFVLAALSVVVFLLLVALLLLPLWEPLLRRRVDRVDVLTGRYPPRERDWR